MKSIRSEKERRKKDIRPLRALSLWAILRFVIRSSMSYSPLPGVQKVRLEIPQDPLGPQRTPTALELTTLRPSPHVSPLAGAEEMVSYQYYTHLPEVRQRHSARKRSFSRTTLPERQIA